MNRKRNIIEAIYPLAPMQQGMLFHSLYATGSGVYNIQIVCTLQGDVDIPAFQHAWQQVAERHSIFRTAFVWEHSDEPVQVVYRHVRLPWIVEDLRERSSEEQGARLAAFLADDRRQEFKLIQAPLMRLALFQVDSDTYRLVWSYHHILLDGWSLPIVLNEVLRYHDAFAHGREVQLPYPRPYRDYIVWLRQQDLARAEAFWRQALAGFTAPTPLGVDRLIESASDVAGYAEQQLQLTSTTTAALQTFARQHGLTLNTLVQGAWAILLSHYSGETDVVFGITVAGRPPELAGAEGMVGLFINTLPMRVRAALDALLPIWLQQVQGQQAELHQYEYSPLMDVQGWSEVPRGQPLFESIVVFENYPVQIAATQPDNHARLSIRDVQSEDRNNYPLTLGVGPGQELALQLVYDCRRFAAAAISRMLGHLHTLLEGMADNPARRLADLPFLTAAERRQILVEWNAPQSGVRSQESGVRSASSDSWLPASGSWCIHQLFEVQVERVPDAVAVVFERPTTNDHHRDKETRRQGDKETGFIAETQSPTPNTQHPTPGTQCLTYHELNTHANQLAHYLQGLGVGPDVLVGICLARSLDLIVGLLGVLKSGGAYLPLDPAYPKERLAFMLTDSQASVLLTWEQLADTLPTIWMPAICLDSAWPLIAQANPTNPTSAVWADQLAYVIYTSGSTGTPKGVAVAQRGLTNLALAQVQAFAIQPDHRVLQFASLSFDAAVSEVFMALSASATLCLSPQEMLLPGPDLLGLIDERRITAVTLPPSALAALPEVALPGLQTLIVAGEPCSAALAARWAAGRHFFNAYGPTEATVCATIGYGSTGDQPPPIGRPIANTQVYVLDAQRQPVPIGVPGEIYIGGVGVARGYLGRPDLTAERFIPNPFAGVLGIGCWVLEDSAPNTQHPTPIPRLYRTGDLARYRPDGNLEFLGRRDLQVKIRGFRVELGEIEAVLGQHSAVRQVAVIAREDVPGEQRLVAYLVPRREQETGNRGQEGISSDTASLSPVTCHLSPDELRVFLKEKLPDYMVPAAFVLLDSLPLTPHGKIDRRALPLPDSSRPELGNVFVAPRTPVEELLAQLWIDVLRLERVGVHDHFFDLGGNSLLATQLVSRIRDAFQVELPIAGLFEASTIARLAGRIEAARKDAPGLLVPPLQPALRAAPLPLSFAQQRLWFLDQLAPRSPVYNVPTALQLRGPLNVVALARSLSAIVARHEALRTSFALLDGQPVQVIAPARPLALALLNLEGLPPAIREELSRRLAAGEAHSPFDLARGPLLRVILLRLAADEHVLLLTMHHIVADGWSVNVFCRELVALYAAGFHETPAALPDLPIQYADYAVWQRQWLQGTALETQLAYWREQLADLPTLQLPTDRLRPADPSFRGADHPFVLSAALSQAIMALSRQEGVTLFMTLAAAWQVLLARYSGQDDIAVGVPIANRTRAEIESLIGFFVNTLVLRSSLAGNPPFRTLLRRVREICLGAYAHQDLPFEQVVEATGPARDLRHHPLFQVMVVFQNAPLAPLALPELTLSLLPIPTTTTRFDLTLSLAVSTDSLTGVLEYSTDLFDAATIARMAEHFQILLAGIVVDPARSLADLPLMTAAERQQLLVDWNTTQTAYPHDQCIHELFAAQVARTPDAVAAVFDRGQGSGVRETRRQGNKETRRYTETPPPTPNTQHPTPNTQHLTYHELNARANQLARHLQKIGVRPETLVGLYLERSLELLIGLLGVLKAGSAYVPLDPAYPQERLAFMFEDAQISVLLTQERLISTLPDHAAHIICLDVEQERIAHTRVRNLVNTARPENLVYMIYTSGSTGTPKGIMVRHHGLVNFTAAMVDLIGLQLGQRFLQFASFSFDASAMQIFPTLTSGATLVLHIDPARLSHHELQEFCAWHQITILDLPAAFWQQWVEEMAAQNTTLPLAIQVCMTGGESITADRLRTWARLTGRCVRFLSSYGPTETTVTTTMFSAASDQVDRLMSPNVPLGCLIANTQIYLLDTHMHPVPIGVPGEIYIGGAGLARGYLNRPDLTAERFIPNPFAEDKETRRQGDKETGDAAPPTQNSKLKTQNLRLYRTGDLARYRTDGNIEFLGRLDQQVKIRGFRVEVGEIETALRRHPSVQECAVVAREDTPGEKRLVGYVVPEIEDRRLKIEDSNLGSSERLSSIFYPLSSELRAFLKERLPDYMVPAVFVVMEALPLTPSGKVDRRALPIPNAAHSASKATFVAPRTQVEELLAQVWADVLRLERIGVHDNFFEIGGHSLLATKVILRVRETCGVDLPLRHLFEAPTIAGLTQQVEATRRDAPYFHAPPLRPAVHAASLPLSFAQQRLWFLDQLQPDSPVYNMPMALRLAGPLDAAALEQSLTAIICRHEALRTTFATIDGRPVQVIAACQAIPLPIIDLRGFSPPARGVEAVRLAAEEARRPFKLARGPLLRATLLRLEPEEHMVLLTMHHIVSDGWSMRILIQEVTILYTAFAVGRRASLPELPIQYADYALWQRQWLQGEVLEGHLAYWRRQLADLPALDLPADWPRSSVTTFQGATQDCMLSKVLIDELLALSRREGATLFMTLLAAFQVLLARYSGQDDIAVGTPIANRTRREIEGLIGFFVNTLVLRGDLSGNPTFRELLRRIRECCLEAYAHQDLPFEQVVEELQPIRDLTRTPLFQAMFNMLAFDVADIPVEMPGLAVASLPAPASGSKFDLTLYVRESHEGTQLELVYNTELFARARMAELLEQLRYLLIQIVRRPDEHIGRFSLVTPTSVRYLPDPTQALCCEWDGAVHSQVSRWAYQAPGQLAIVDRAAAWSYQELDARSNQLAHYLQAHGIRSHNIVAIYGHRSASLVWAVLGVLKAGAAFIILDPAYPSSWLTDCLDVAMPQGWIQLEGAGSPPDALGKLTATYICCLELPQDPSAEAYGQLTGCSTDAPAVTVGPDDLAYVAFTSGSTGRPKGICGTHRPLAHFLGWHQRTFSLGATDRFSMLSGLAYDPLLRDIFTPLWLGATLYIPHPDEIGLPERLAEWMYQAHITVVHLTPALGRLLTGTLPADPSASGWPAPLRSLRYAFFGGDVLTMRDVARLRELAPRATCVNCYGATETPQVMGYYIVPAHEGHTRNDISSQEWLKEAIPLGQGIEAVQLLILNSAQQLAGIGELGEICVRTPYLSKGYLGDEALTRERFIPDPFGGVLGIGCWVLDKADSPNTQHPIPNTRLYRTGDLGRYLPTGDVEFLGRADAQVKIRGFRVEPGAIEVVLGQHPAVQQCVVLAREDTPGEKRLVAYVVQGSGVRSPESGVGDQDILHSAFCILHSDELRDFLRERLPNYMVPNVFVPLPALPLTPNGKVDYRALPAPDQGRLAPESDSRPRTMIEERLAGIWADVLHVGCVGIHDNFFALGGDSILSIQLIARANQAGFQLTPKQLFQHQTIAQLAAVAGITPIIAEQRPVEGPLPLTPAQHRFFEQGLTDLDAWNEARLLEARRSLSPTVIARVMQELLARHDALRLRFVREDSGWRQINTAAEPMPLIQVDLSALSEADQRASIEVMAADLRASLDLTAGPVLWVAYFDLGSRRTGRLLIIVHHLVMDSASWHFLLEDFQIAYLQLCHGETLTLAPQTASFQQWAARLAAHAQSETLQQELDYWLAEARVRVAPLPLDYPIGASTDTGASTRIVSRWLGAEETQALIQRVPAAYHARIDDVLLTALAQAFSHWTAARSLLIDLEERGREQFLDGIDLSRTIGQCTISFPVLLDLDSDGGSGEELKRIKEQLRGVPNRGIGYGLLRYLSENQNSVERLEALPQAEVSFAYLGQLDQALRDSSLFRPTMESFAPARGRHGSRRYLLEVTGFITGEQLRFDWVYSENIHRRSTIERLADNFAAALRGLIDHCLAPEAGGYTPSDFPKMRFSQAELDDLIAELSEENEG